MAHAQLVNECSFAIPRKIRTKIGERHIFIRKRSKSSVPDDVGSNLLRTEIYRTCDFDERRRTEFRFFERFAQTESIKKCLQIEAALNLEFGDFAFPIPIGTTGDTAPVVAPLIMCNIQPLIVPFCGSGRVSYFIAVALQSVPAQRRLDSSLFDFRNVSGEFHLQRRGPRGELELF